MPRTMKNHPNYKNVSSVFIYLHQKHPADLLNSPKSKKIPSKMILNHSRFRDNMKNCVGSLKAVMKINGRETACYSTAFAISPSIIVTCAHAIFNSDYKTICSYAEFIPANGPVNESNIFRTKAKGFLLENKIKHQQYRYRPLRSDYAVLILDRPLQLSSYMLLSKKEPFVRSQLEVWGYPHINQHKTPKAKQQLKRIDLCGKFVESKGDQNGKYILLHNMPTKIGHSGSPIVEMKDDRAQVMGIHTHRGLQGCNQGLLMSVLRKKILADADKLLSNHGLFDELRDFKKMQEVEKQQQNYEEQIVISLIQNDRVVNRRVRAKGHSQKYHVLSSYLVEAC